MRRAAVFCALLTSCVTPPKPTPRPVDDAQPKSVKRVDSSNEVQVELRHLIEGFVTSTEARDFAAVHAMLSKALRDRYTPMTLARDFEAEPYARERLGLIKAKGAGLLSVQGGAASLEWAPGRALRLVRESSAWKIASLE